MKKVTLIMIGILIYSIFNGNMQIMAKENKEVKKYDVLAKTIPSVNDVYSAIFNWFAMFDHQKNVNLFIDYIDPNNINYDFLGEKITSIEEFKSWYRNVENNIQYNSHMVKDLKVEKTKDNQYNIQIVIEWKAKLYNETIIEKTINQNIEVRIMENKIYIVQIKATEETINTGK